MSDEKEILKESLPYIDTSRAIFSGPAWEIIGKSAGGHDIVGKLLSEKSGAKKALLIGGVHGNETEGVRFMEEFTREFAIDKSISPLPCQIYLIPVFNPDGFLSFKRGNVNGVDLNRNMPTKDWSGEFSEPKYFPGTRACSEPETSIMMKVIREFNPDFIISFHSWKPMININGPAMPFAEVMKKKISMEIVEDIGYPTPGSLGTYAGWERQIPTITLEFERGVELDSIYPSAKDAILDALRAL
jgi:protein MpaA